MDKQIQFQTPVLLRAGRGFRVGQGTGSVKHTRHARWRERPHHSGHHGTQWQWVASDPFSWGGRFKGEASCWQRALLRKRAVLTAPYFVNIAQCVYYKVFLPIFLYNTLKTGLKHHIDLSWSWLTPPWITQCQVLTPSACPCPGALPWGICPFPPSLQVLFSLRDTDSFAGGLEPSMTRTVSDPGRQHQLLLLGSF